jgi:hypothetical protein
MNAKITRRDFLNGVLLGAGALVLDLPAPLRLLAQSRQREGFGGVGDLLMPNSTGTSIGSQQSMKAGGRRDRL